jgi:hypothetical protein
VRKVKRWRASEVLAFIEYKASHNEATQEEMELYENVKWNDGKLNKTNYVIKSLVNQMNREYNGL